MSQPETSAEPIWDREPCPICGAAPGTDCAGDVGYGCPSWEQFKEDHPEYQEQEP